MLSYMNWLRFTLQQMMLTSFRTKELNSHTAVKLAAKGTAERTAELLRLEQLAEELQARSEEMRARTRSSKYFGKGRMLRAYPKLKHGQDNRSLSSLLEQLEDEYPDSFNGFGIQ